MCPIISHDPVFQEVALIETSDNMLVSRNDLSKNFRVLIPTDVPLANAKMRLMMLNLLMRTLEGMIL